MIDLDCLASFVAVVDTGSFGAAAAHRGLSQSGVSQHVARIEAALGERLLVRGRRASLPSEAGSRLLPYARELLALEARARESVAPSRLALGASGNIATYLLPELVRRFGETPAGCAVAVDLSIGSNPDVLRRLGHRLLDLALTEWVPADPALRATAWHREPLGVIVPPGHRLACGGPLSIDQLAAEPMIGGEPGSGTATLLRERFGEAARRLPVRQAFGSTEGVKRAVMAGLGVSIVMRVAVQAELDRGALVWRELEGEPLVKTLQLVRRAGDGDGALAERFARFLQAAGAPRARETDQASRPAL